MDYYFSWIQLSDIHFKNNETYNTEKMREKLLEQLEIYKGVDALVLSGDFRFGPDKERNPEEVISFIIKCSQVLGIPSERIFLVPGNHDIDRNTARSYIVQGIKNDYKPIEGMIKSDLIDGLNKDFAFYEEIRKRLNPESAASDNNPHVLVDAGKAYFLLINTELVADGNETRDLLVGTTLVKRALDTRQEEKPVIAVGHHGYEFWDLEEKDACFKMMQEEGVQLYLCGHAHHMNYTFPGQRISQVTAGCLTQSTNLIESAIVFGAISFEGSVSISADIWNPTQLCWEQRPAYNKEGLSKYDMVSEAISNCSREKPFDNDFVVTKYRLLGTLGGDGIKYIWQKGNRSVESIAFNKITKDDNSKELVSGYTISTSFGCQLNVCDEQCIFCGTGMSSFKGELTPEEIALQCIFMAEYDSDCASFVELKDYEREFAFMGQGEPGFNYTAVREAIILNDIAMEELHQKVSRYVISTCGIRSFMPQLIEDVRNKVFKNPVTVHFSLNVVPDDRSALMPINRSNDCLEFLNLCRDLFALTKTKIGVSLLLLKDYKYNKLSYSLTKEKLESILKILDKKVFRIDLYSVNKCGKGSQQPYNNQMATDLLRIVENNGFEGKIKRQFGDSCLAGFGMLDSKDKEISDIGKTTQRHFKKSIELLKTAKSKRRDQLSRSVGRLVIRLDRPKTTNETSAFEENN